MELLRRAISEQEYYDLIYRKTACLFQISMQLGSVLAGTTPEVEAQLGEYGRNLGLAFQIVDDVLDLTADEEMLGKPAASDLREGKATLAVVHALQHGSREERAAIAMVLEDRSFVRVGHARILEILRHNGSLDAAMRAAHTYAEAARNAVAVLPESEYKRALLWVPDFVVAREK